MGDIMLGWVLVCVVKGTLRNLLKEISLGRPCFSKCGKFSIVDGLLVQFLEDHCLGPSYSLFPCLFHLSFL